MILYSMRKNEHLQFLAIFPITLFGCSPTMSEPNNREIPIDISIDMETAAIQSHLDLPFPTPQVLQRYYLEAMNAGDEQCPGFDNQMEEGSIPLEGCTASTGWTYRGLSEYTERISDDKIQSTLDLGDFYIATGTGDWFETGGTFQIIQERNDTTSWEGYSTGSFLHTADTGWLSDFTGLAIWMEVHNGIIQLDGGISRLTMGTSLFFSQVYLSHEYIDGQLSWNTEWGWLDIHFSSSSNGCGVAFVEQQSIAEICLEFDQFIQSFHEIAQ